VSVEKRTTTGELEREWHRKSNRGKNGVKVSKKLLKSKRG